MPRITACDSSLDVCPRSNMSNSRHTKRRMITAYTVMCATAIFILASASGCGSGSDATSNAVKTGSTTAETVSTVTPSNGATIRLQNIAIKPSKVTIQRGSTVTWQWLDGHIDTAHNVTSLPGGPQFKASGTRQTGSYTVRFNTPGKYLYECTIHPASMQGEIVVE